MPFQARRRTIYLPSSKRCRPREAAREGARDDVGKHPRPVQTQRGNDSCALNSGHSPTACRTGQIDTKAAVRALLRGSPPSSGSSRRDRERASDLKHARTWARWLTRKVGVILPQPRPFPESVAVGGNGPGDRFAAVEPVEHCHQRRDRPDVALGDELASSALNLAKANPRLRPLHLVVRETKFCGLRLAGYFRRRMRENSRNSVRRPRCASLTRRNYGGFCLPGNRPGLSGLHGGGCRNRTDGHRSLASLQNEAARRGFSARNDLTQRMSKSLAGKLKALTINRYFPVSLRFHSLSSRSRAMVVACSRALRRPQE